MKSVVGKIIGGFLPIAAKQDDLDEALAAYFVRVLCAALGISLSYLFLVAIVGLAIPPQWLMSMGFLWFPIAYTMKAELHPLQDDYNESKEFLKQLRFMPGVIAALVTMWWMSRLPKSDAPLSQLVPTALAVAYLMSLWNVSILAAMLNWRMFDKGGIIAAMLGIFIASIWAYIENH